MPADRLLNTVLQLYRSVHDDAKTDQIVGSTTSLLTTLSNPLNIGVLTSQLLTAPAIWNRRDGLRTSLRIIGIYNTAAIRVRDQGSEPSSQPHPHPQPQHPYPGYPRHLRLEEWTRAVAKGTDDRSSRWKHLLVLTGVLMGMEGNGSESRTLSSGLRNTLQQAVVTAANLALETVPRDGPLAAPSIVLALNYAFPLLSEVQRSSINGDALLPLSVQAITGDEGFQQGDFLTLINRDVHEVGQQLHWAPETPSFHRLQSLEAKPLMAGMGPLSKLAAFAVEHAANPSVVLGAHNALLDFSRSVMQQWRTNKLSGVDPSGEPLRLTPNALQVTTPVLWQTLQKILYATVTVLQAVVARSLLDSRLRSDQVAPGLADGTLRILRNLFFIGSRNENSAFQTYSFTYLTSLDVMARYPGASTAFLSSLKPAAHSSAGADDDFLRRTLDLFYLNVAEHLPLHMPTEACDELIVQPATAYLTQNSAPSSLTVQLFEASHSAILSVLACPHNSPLTLRLVPFYVDTLFASFPAHISPRQFRIAFRTVMRIVSPPFPISVTEPHLSETLLEMVRFRALTADTAPLRPRPGGDGNQGQQQQGEEQEQEQEQQKQKQKQKQKQNLLSEQSSLVLTLIDALPFLPLPLVEDWLTTTAQTMNGIADHVMREPVKARFLEVLVSGELDVERASIGVAWWGTKGGKDLVLGRAPRMARQEEVMMSGAIAAEERTSKL
ncbi:peroxin 8 [Sodiomyces alkalinus F11]|uniref:Peroxin 8 n=1 Tax=Sodiomyces alkalinus (strain CBS 110278 / VKM F-3762 / F11) TaxID=1314773 RepID=A0A3N2PVP7_SODAK|nr:peroxin 8 [Sodiomyces alkalinus F11]ROT38571.1 peroxin 8 [Sodiomyces alkalinus F11]